MSEEIERLKAERSAPEASLAPSVARNDGGEERRRSQEGGRVQGEEEGVRGRGRRRRKGVILTDSNGREATEHSVKNHMPREVREDYEIAICVAYTLEEAFHRVSRGEIDVRGATVIVDNITNDVRGTRQRPATTPEETTFRVDRLRKKLLAVGAEAVIIAEIKPMQHVDVRPHNHYLHNYLQAQGEDGIRTQIRMNYLRHDGFHVGRQFDSLVDKTYACALLGVPVPCPTPIDDFEPDHVRRRRDIDWPVMKSANAQMVRTNEGQNRVHGWEWR